MVNDLKISYSETKEQLKPSVIGFNCGVGNLLGFHQQDFDIQSIIDGRDFIRKGSKTFTENFPGIQYSKKEEDLKAKSNINVIISSPSCAQVSSLGVKRPDRKNLWDLELPEFEFVRVLDLLFERDADFIVIEYIKSLTRFIEFTHLGLRRGDYIYEFPEEYRSQLIQLNAIDFHVPQKRKRIFLFLSKRKFNFVYHPPMTFIGNPKTNGEVLKELDELRAKGKLLNDEPMKHSQARIDGFKALEQGKSYYGMHNNKKLIPDKYCQTITSHCTQYVHPWHARTLTPREAATFQGFPLDFEFYGSYMTQLDLVGRSISPPIANHIAQEIRESLDIYYSNIIGK